MASNVSDASSLPPLPSYTLRPVAPLFPPIEDKYLTLILPVLAYWTFSLVFHIIDTQEYFSKYRLHTPAEILKRNHASRWEVARDVIIQHVVQTVVGMGVASFEEPQMVGKEEYSVAAWAQKIRLAQRALPGFLSAFGLDSQGLARNVMSTSPMLAGALQGGHYSWLVQQGQHGSVPAFAPWELFLAKAIFWIIIPALQFGVAIIIVDTWQYFLHRAMHMNKWLYTTLHSRHHRLYVPYAFGALYNHPVEGFLLDTVGTVIAYVTAGLTPRQCMWFFTLSTLKTVDDHCGYALPWDPLQHLSSNNAGYHDVHHQSWGIKTNFSQPFFTFWDCLLGTAWTGGDVSARYERAKLAAERRVASESSKPSSITASKPVDSILEPPSPYSTTPDSESIIVLNGLSQPQPPAGKATAQALNSREQILQTWPSHGGGRKILTEETAEEQREVKKLNSQQRRSPRKSITSSPTSQAGSLKGLRDRVGGGGGFHGRTGSLLGYEGKH